MNYNKQQNITEAMTRPTAEEQNHHKMPKIKGITASVWDNLRYGNFYHQLLPFYEVFGDEGMIFLDGTNMGTIRNENRVSVPRVIKRPTTDRDARK